MKCAREKTRASDRRIKRPLNSDGTESSEAALSGAGLQNQVGNQAMQRLMSSGQQQRSERQIEAVTQSPGSQLDPALRDFFEPALGADLGSVRVHTDLTAAASARAVSARAYAVGEHLAFDTGQFSPNSGDGRRLLAHELAHVVQQRGGSVAVHRQVNPEPEATSSDSAGPSISGPQSYRVQTVPRWPYPAIAAALPSEVVSLRASASLQLPLSVMLRYDTRFEDRDIWDEFLANRRAHGDDQAAAALIHNEIMRRYFAGKISLSDPVRVDVTPPFGDEMPTVEFALHGKPIETPDGLIGMAELSALQPWDDVIKRVQQDADSVETAARLLGALDELEPAVADLKRVRAEPEDFALKDVGRIRWYVQEAKRVADDWACRVGPATSAAKSLMARYEQMEQTASDAAVFMSHWHAENTMESAGQANVRRGMNTSHTSVRVFWGIVDVGEKILSLGNHDARTSISENYAEGTISWNEAKGMVSKANERAMLSALALRAGGMFGRGVGGGFLSKLGITGRTAGILGGSFGGVTSSAAMMATQNIVTRSERGKFSQQGAQIWNAGSPGGADWGIGLVFGGIQGTASPLEFGPSEGPPTAPLSNAPPSPIYAGSGPLGIFQRLAVWSRLRFGEPIMRGVSETNQELVSGAAASPGYTQPGPAEPGFEPGTEPGPVYGPSAVPFSPTELASISGIAPAEVQSLTRIPSRGWINLLQYARANSNEHSAKGKVGEELYYASPNLASRATEARQTAAQIGIPQDAVQFTTNVKGLAPTQTTSGTSAELTDGIFYAISGGKLYILGIVESKSRSNQAELAQKVVDDEREFLGQFGWDFERLRENPVKVNGQTFEPKDVVVSRNFTRFIGVLPESRSLSQASMQRIQDQVKNISIDRIDVRDVILSELARMLIAAARGS